MSEPLQTRKLARRFELLDSNHDGYLERDDFEQLARRLVAGFGQSPDGPKGAAVIASYQRYWQDFVSRLDADGDDRVTREEFTAGVGRITDPTEFDRIFRPHVEAVGALADTNDNGTIEQAEFIRLLSLFGVDAPDAKIAFAEIDRDGNGHVTVDEHLAAVRDFYLTRGRSDSHFGPV